MPNLLRVPLVLVSCLLTLLGSSTALAAAPQLSNGSQLSSDQPYGNAQSIPNVYENKSIYGKLQGDTPIDIYKFTPDHDGSQTVSLLTMPMKAPASTSQLSLIFVDPTSATTAEDLGLPLPSSDYHTALLKPAESGKTVTEPVMLRTYSLLQQETVTLKKGTTYYMVVLDPYRVASRYVIKLGTGNSWTAADFFRSFPTWFRLQADSYAGSSPFSFTATTASFLVFLLGLLAIAGMGLVQGIFAMLSNRSRAAGFLLAKLQPFSRVTIWVALWFMGLGGLIYFNRVGWTGLPFVLALLFIPLAIAFLYQTIRLSPRLAEVETTKKEAAIPFALRKRWFFSLLVELFSLGAFLVFLAMYFAK